MYILVKWFEKMANTWCFWGSLYESVCRNLVEKEVASAKITSADRVLHVGCGALPYTAKIIAETGAEVTAIDIDPEAVKKARAFLNGSAVKVELVDGKNFSYKEFDVVVVSHGVRPKRDILGNIYASLKPGARLVYRNAEGIIGYLYNGENVLLPGGKELKQKQVLFRKSVVLQKT